MTILTVVAPSRLWRPPIRARMSQRIQPHRKHPITHPPATSEEDDSIRAADLYGDYDPTLKPDVYICPFADTSRRHPCTALQGQKKSKTQVTNHLISLKNRNSDECHPINDRLWNTRLVKNYYLIKQPQLTEEQRRLARRARNKRGYQKRKIASVSAKEKLANGQIDETGYRKLLVGKARWDYDVEQRVKQEKTKAKADAEEELQRLFNERVQELSNNQQTAINTAELSTLSDLQKSLDDANSSVIQFKNTVCKLASNFVSMVARKNDDDTDINCERAGNNTTHNNTITLGDSEEDMLTFVGLGFPTTTDEPTYYYYAALCLPQLNWDDAKPWEGNVA